MLTILARGERSPAELARLVGIPVNLAAYHMKVLTNHGAVRMVRKQSVRGSVEHFYKATVAITLVLRPGPYEIVFRKGRVFKAKELVPEVRRLNR